MRAVLFGILAGMAIAKPVPSSSDSSDSDHSDPHLPLPHPTRQLNWGDVNVLHTTDIHGWISGHSKQVYPDLSWNANFGDFDSFVIHMRKKAKRRGSDLLLVDTGDRRIGHGLTDHVLDPKHGVNGQSVSQLYLDVGYDLVIPGNHDLQTPNVVKWTKDTLAQRWGDKYLTSNIYRTDEVDSEGKKPLGVRLRYWETPMKKHMMAFGVVTNKTGLPKDSGLEVIPINQVVEQQWFKDAIKRNANQPVDVFVLLGHVDPKKYKPEDDISLMYKAIRREHPLTPIMIFAGHSHQRWCRTFQGEDGSIRSMLLQSGRYFDTVGWMSVKLDDNKTPRHLEFSRRFLDNNVPTYMYHTGIENQTAFDTLHGANITKFVRTLEASEKLSEPFGWMGSDYYLDREVWSEDDKDDKSLFKFYLNAVEHSLIDRNKSPNWLFLSNWGILRGDIYQGNFTMLDLYAISPGDESSFLHAKVNRHIAEQIVRKFQDLERGKKATPQNAQDFEPNTLGATTDNSQSRLSLFSRRSINPTYGWETTDLCWDQGDDAGHTKIPQVSFDNPKSGLPVYFWRKSYKSSDLQAEDEVDVIVTHRAGDKYGAEALRQLESQATFAPYREDVNQKNLLEIYIKAMFPYKGSSSGQNTS